MLTSRSWFHNNLYNLADIAETLQQLYVKYMNNKECDKIHDTNPNGHGEIADGVTVCAGGKEGI